MKKSLGVGLIGCGGISRGHVNDYYKKNPEAARLVAAAEISPELRQRYINDFNIGTMYASVQELLADPNVDVVDICTPPDSHSELIQMAARAGKHVLCEKPIASDMESAVRAVEVAEECGVVLGVMQNYRFRPEYLEAHNYLINNKLGRPFFGTMEGFFNWNGGSYRTQSSRMLIIEQAYHYIDLLRYLFNDDVVRVYAAAGKSEAAQVAGESWGSLTLHFSRGAVGTIVASGECHGFQANWGGSAVIQCTAGTMEINRKQLFSLNVYVVGGGGHYPLQTFPKEEYSANTNAPFTRPLDAFYQTVLDGRKPPVSGRDNLNTLATALACYDSIASAQAINVN
ncbi:Gfo/Idh/MocA family protein [Paenibacillus agricola]|uniref:Gfo/Idh/MocA family oxidoreductase n=1 Tax=Paenibacillus agricola TaxID=2716264 RepID=A0ABX0JFI6_9BACL|nr:Gfo/Idh/MocA family oxidoreductase [Paenibacillus agricola]NHN34922.1 Gfo/Idh/MocA family oxidoreductase [Paenibacillus agricola]